MLSSNMPLSALLYTTLLGVLISKTFVCSHNTTDKSFTTSAANMEQLLFTEKLAIDIVVDYIKTLQAKVETLQNLINALRKENEKALQNPEKYLYNPLNGYSLIRRMHYDWPKIELYMEKPLEDEYLKELKNFYSQMPTSSDLTEASEAIYRLQTTYDLQPIDMAVGILNGQQYSTQLTSLDCYFMGHHFLGINEYYHAEAWFKIALKSYAASDYNRVLQFGKENIWLLYAETLLNQNRFKNALAAIIEACTLLPADAYLLKRRRDIEYLEQINTLPPQQLVVSDPSPYELGCRGAFSNLNSRLHCIYNTTASAFLRLAPLKMEILHLQPYMIVFHDVLSDREIQELKDITKPQLKRSKVYSSDLDRHELAGGRTSQSSYLQDEFSNPAMRIHQRIEDMTGFNLKGSDKLQVVNYGLGGHYELHYDFFNVSDTVDIVRHEGDRIATVLFYLSDVEQGGATVFPHIKTAVFPRKGSAVVWYNLNNRLEYDLSTLHAACPVLVGSKWIANKWIRARPQILKRPCFE